MRLPSIKETVVMLSAAKRLDLDYSPFGVNHPVQTFGLRMTRTLPPLSDAPDLIPQNANRLVKSSSYGKILIPLQMGF